MSNYTELFHTIDTDHNGELSLDEFSSFCETLPQSPTSSVIQRLFSQADVDNSGFIDETEFAALCEGVKLLTKLSEAEMVEAYGISELRRLFQYSAANGVCLRKNELRKAADVLNEGLNLRLTSDALSQAVHRECAEDEINFHQFKAFVSKIAPTHGLSSIVAAFREEESRRKDRLTKVKSMFELRPKASHGLDGRRPAAPGTASGPCQRCAELEAENEELLQKDSKNRLAIDSLTHRATKAEEDAAMLEVDHQRKVLMMEKELDDLRPRNADLENDVAGLEAAQQAALERNTVLQRELEASRIQCERAQAELEGVDTVKADSEQLVGELKQCQERLGRSQAEVSALRVDNSRLQSLLTEKADEATKAARLVEEMAESKNTEDEQSRSAIAQIKQQCMDREEAAREREAHAMALKERILCLERELNEREDSVTERERKIRQLEAKQRAKWEEKFVKAANDLTERERRLHAAETEAGTRNAELQVREQLLEQNTKRAEAISLPERERRLRVLQGVENELCERERRLRQAEAGYISKLLDPRIEELKEDNRRLREQVAELHADRDGASNYARGGSRTTSALERGMMSPSFKLL